MNTHPNIAPAIGSSPSGDHSHTGRLLAMELKKRLSEFNLETTLTKRERVTVWLTIAAKFEIKVTRFDAEWIGDHCFNSTVSDITSVDHIIVDRIPAKRPTRFGKSTDCKEYWLQGKSLEAAIARCNRILKAKSAPTEVG